MIIVSILVGWSILAYIVFMFSVFADELGNSNNIFEQCDEIIQTKSFKVKHLWLIIPLPMIIYFIIFVLIWEGIVWLCKWVAGRELWDKEIVGSKKKN